MLILAVSLDSLAYGIALGFNKVKISFLKSVIMTLLSTLIFFLCLLLSSEISSHLKDYILYLINGSALMGLGVFYIVNSFKEKNITKTYNNQHYIIHTLIFSLDAAFSALLSAYSFETALFATIIYLIVTFVFIFVANRLSYLLPFRLNINFGFISGLLFIILGILKILEI